MAPPLSPLSAQEATLESTAMTIRPTTDQDLPAWFHELTPLFVVGCPRSGTTWIQRMLLELDGVVGGPETHFFPAFASTFQAYRDSASEGKKVGLGWYLEEDELLRELRRIWVVLMAPLVEHAESPQVLLEKTPNHVRFAQEVHSLLPEARFLHVIRDGRAVVASLLAASKSWGRAWAPSSVDDAIRMWSRDVRAGLEARELVGDAQYLEIRYEDVHAQPLESLRRIARFAGLDPKDEALGEAVHLHDAATIRSGKGHAAWAGEPEGFLRKANPDAWREDLGFWTRRRVRRRAGTLLDALGYDSRG